MELRSLVSKLQSFVLQTAVKGSNTPVLIRAGGGNPCGVGFFPARDGDSGSESGKLSVRTSVRMSVRVWVAVWSGWVGLWALQNGSFS